MSNTSQSLSHSRWHCKDHVVFVPKRRRKALFGHICKALGPIFHALARQKACRILEGHVMPDHVHMGIEMPPKQAVASVIGFLKGKSASAVVMKWTRPLCGSAAMSQNDFKTSEIMEPQEARVVYLQPAANSRHLKTE